MTRPDPDDDAALDRRLRSASEVPFDDIATTGAVLAKVHAARRTAPSTRSGNWALRLGPAAFASILFATPFLVANYPAPDGSDAMILGLALGDPRAVMSDAAIGPFTGLEGFLE